MVFSSRRAASLVGAMAASPEAGLDAGATGFFRATPRMSHEKPGHMNF